MQLNKTYNSKKNIQSKHIQLKTYNFKNIQFKKNNIKQKQFKRTIQLTKTHNWKTKHTLKTKRTV